VLLAAQAAGCAAVLSPRDTWAQDRSASSDPPAEPAGSQAPPDEPLLARALGVARLAASYVGARRLVVGGRRFRFDCSSFARAVYLQHGIDLFAEIQRATTGVRAIQRYVREHGRLFHEGPPRPGDLVFFDDTYDRNRDGRRNDRLSHVGIVEEVREDGTVVFVSRLSRTIRRDRMHLGVPDAHRAADGRVLNDHLRRRRRGEPASAATLAAQLFAGFGTLDVDGSGRAESREGPLVASADPERPQAHD
jgi:hypothetical protein